MAEEKIDLKKEVFDKNQYTQTIDTEFNELNVFNINETTAQEPDVDKFFEMYDELFYDIPAIGDTNSHQFLIEQSSAYINYNNQSEEIEALRLEISQLRKELLDEQMKSLTNLEGSNPAVENELKAQIEQFNTQQQGAIDSFNNILD